MPTWIYTGLNMTYPHEMYGSTNLNMLMEALLSLTKTPLLICLSLNNCKAFFTLGLTWLILNRNILRKN